MKVIVGLVDGKRVPLVLEKKQCVECSLEFQPLTQQSKFCSKECSRKWTRKLTAKRHDDKLHGGKRKELIEVNGLKCSKCGKEGNSYEIVAHHITLNPADHSQQELLCRACHARLHHSVPKKDITKEQIDEAIANTGSLKETCSILGINRASLYVKRKKFGCNFNAQYNEKILSKEEIEQAIKYSKTMHEAADCLGLDYSTLFDKKKKLGITVHCESPRESERKIITKEQIEEALKSSDNLDIVSSNLGICRASLYKKRKKFGLI